MMTDRIDAVLERWLAPSLDAIGDTATASAIQAFVHTPDGVAYDRALGRAEFAPDRPFDTASPAKATSTISARYSGVPSRHPSSITTISTGWCNNSSARPILGINTSLGRAAVFLDRNPRDSSGSDITGGWTSARNWTNKAYGQ